MIDQFFNAFTISSLLAGHSPNETTLNLPPPMAGFGVTPGGHRGQPQGQPGGDNQLGRFGGHQHQAVGPHQGHAGRGNQWP